jgi:uncharacterized integral membrane protein (TIGR00697 family)
MKEIEYNYYRLVIFHTTSIIIGMTLTTRMIFLGDFYDVNIYITGGLLIIPVSFFLQDLVTEIYGFKKARTMIFISLSAFVLYVLILYVIADMSENIDSNFQKIVFSMPRHLLSFIIALIIGGLINSYILQKLNFLLNERYLAIRFISSTVIGEFFFQIVAVMIAWYGTLSIWEIIPVATLAYIYKIFFEVLMTPFNVVICRKLKKLSNNNGR